MRFEVVWSDAEVAAHAAGTTILAEWDWVYTASAGALHAVRHLEFPAEFEMDAGGPGTTVCGVTTWLSIPGLFSRMGLRRCKRCCAAVGFPQGVGAPKNDDACRPLVEQRLVRIGAA
jgi:hypothetical protein